MKGRLCILALFGLLLTQCVHYTAEDYYNRGNFNANHKKYSRAIRDYNKAIRINPKYSEAYNVFIVIIRLNQSKGICKIT